MKKRSIFWMLLLLAWLVGSVFRLDSQRQTQGARRLEEALRQTAVSCYAAEGRYPPSLDYMQRHYGLRFEQDRYIVHYVPLASNLMPDITVVEVGP